MVSVQFVLLLPSVENTSESESARAGMMQEGIHLLSSYSSTEISLWLQIATEHGDKWVLMTEWPLKPSSHFYLQPQLLLYYSGFLQ